MEVFCGPVSQPSSIVSNFQNFTVSELKVFLVCVTVTHRIYTSKHIPE